ncbi:hypothetical protein [Mycobacterium lepromatosis]|uniref:hypothetical protein n=1 Tax=Mycobacterium lepromatosis TaxID=480418 RepID=UPI000A5460ED|nr:hypothetical protein [Mycobacterium lepromatosis]
MVPFWLNRADASLEQTDVESFAILEPKEDGFHNYLKKSNPLPAEYMLIDKAQSVDAEHSRNNDVGWGLHVLGTN